MFKTVIAQQIEVNKFILPPFGSPVPDIDWIGSTKDASNNLITVGNTIISQDTIALLVTKQSSTGTEIWTTTFFPPSAIISKSYGVAVTTDASSNIYVASTTAIGANGHYDYLILKYSSTGSLQWAKVIDYDGLDDIPSSIEFSNDGSLYIIGTGTDSTSYADYFTVKLNPSTGAEAWRKNYDYNKQLDGAVKMTFDMSNNPIITGFSGSIGGSFALSTVIYNKSNGSVISDYHSTTGINITNPKAFVKDQWDNFYVAEDYNSGNSQDIKLLKFDNNLQYMESDI
ncbi:MAG: hypothetical protein H6576_12385 [Lewinellaceae bacterium]|nr:hypothetical protein [Lewinellaceae bacterium]